MAKYDIGDTVRVTGTFTDSTDTVRDPGAVNLTVKSAKGKMVQYTYAGGDITKASTGVYYKDLDIDTPGRWFYRFWSTGNYKAAGEESFLVVDAQAR